MKINKAQKVVIILSLMVIVLCGIAVLGINYYYRDYAYEYNQLITFDALLGVDSNKDNIIKALKDKKFRDEIKFYPTEQGLKEMEKLSIDELKKMCSERETDIYNKYIKPRNDKRMIMYLVTLSFLILGSTIFFILKLVK